MDTRLTRGQVCITRQSPKPNRSEVVNPYPTDRKICVLFLEVSLVCQDMANGTGDSAVRTKEKSAEAIVVVLGNEGRNWS